MELIIIPLPFSKGKINNTDKIHLPIPEHAVLERQAQGVNHGYWKT